MRNFVSCHGHHTIIVVIDVDVDIDAVAEGTTTTQETGLGVDGANFRNVVVVVVVIVTVVTLLPLLLLPDEAAAVLLFLCFCLPIFWGSPVKLDSRSIERHRHRQRYVQQPPSAFFWWSTKVSKNKSVESNF